MGTRNHFWTVDEGIHECPEGIAGLDNAWEVALENWAVAIFAYQQGDPVQAMFCLGAVIHLVEDMAQPAHTNSDLHGPYNRDSLEEWGGFATIEPMYSWTGHPGAVSPGKFFKPPTKNAIIQRVIDRPGWAGHDEFLDDAVLSNPDDPWNCAQLFWIVYVTNEWANYFASDGESGNTTVPLGWVDYEGLGFPKYLHRNGARVLAQKESALDDNEGGCGHPLSGAEFCNYDGDLSTIAKWGYAAAMKGAGGVIELFRRTVDSAPPITQVTLTRIDDKPYVSGGWNNSPVRVRLSDAVDPTPPGWLQRATGVWTLYGLVDGQEWVPNLTFPVRQLQKTFASSGTNTVQVRSTDNAGNIEHQDVVVKLDVTPPAIYLPYWRDWYFTCELIKATWSATDTPSGLKLVTGTLDGRRLVVNSLINCGRLAPGPHTLVVSAKDRAGNVSIAAHRFSVLLESGVAVGKPVALRGGTTMTYKFSGTLTPQHNVGSTPITVVVAKKVDGAWVVWHETPARIAADGSYGCYVRLQPGRWRSGAEHYRPRAFSGWTKFKVE
jgi:hypothetical protein